MVTGVSSSSSLMAKLLQSQKASAAASLFSKTDTDSNGSVSLTELTSKGISEEQASSLISAADTDKDSSLSEAEFLAYVSQLTSGGLSGGNNVQLASQRDGSDMLAAGDTDGNGALSYNEFAAMKPEDAPADSTDKIFSEIDADSDGSLSSEELDAFSSAMAQGMGGPMGGPPPPPPSDSDDDDSTSVSAILSELIESLSDTSTSSDEDETSSTVTSEQSNEDEIFNYFDQDSDGVVSSTELDFGVLALQNAMKDYLVSLQEG